MNKKEAIETIKDICLTTKQLERVEKALECLLSTPSLPSNLDGAAQRIAYDVCKQLPNGEDKDGIVYYAILAAIAGAEWMAGQGVSWEDKMTYYDGFLIYGQDERAYTVEGDFNEGDEVVVQIRKK